MSEPHAAHPPSELFDLFGDVTVMNGAGCRIGAAIDGGPSA